MKLAFLYVFVFAFIVEVSAQVTNSGSGGEPDENGPNEILKDGCLDSKLRYTKIPSRRIIYIENEKKLSHKVNHFLKEVKRQWIACYKAKPEFGHFIELSLMLTYHNQAKVKKLNQNCQDKNELTKLESNCLKTDEIKNQLIHLKSYNDFKKYIAKDSLPKGGTDCWEDDLKYADEAILNLTEFFIQE